MKIKRVKIYLYIFIAMYCFQSCGVAIKGYLFENTAAPKTRFGAYGYLLFTSNVSRSNNDRYVKIAEAFGDNLADMPKSDFVNNPDLMITYWLLKGSQRKVNEKNYQDMVNSYDYDRSFQILGSVHQLSEQGPFLIAWTRPADSIGIADRNKNCLIFNLSKFSDADADRAIKIWRQMLTSGVSNWNTPYTSLIKFRETVRNIFQQSGECIVDLISKN